MLIEWHFLSYANQCGGKERGQVIVTHPQVPCVTQRGSKELDLWN
jgi:hypothetical protein